LKKVAVENNKCVIVVTHSNQLASAADVVLELKDKEDITLDEVCRTVAERDAMDMNRTESPLICVDDAVVVETDHLTIEETVQTLINLIRNAELGGHHG